MITHVSRSAPLGNAVKDFQSLVPGQSPGTRILNGVALWRQIPLVATFTRSQIVISDSKSATSISPNQR